MRYGLLLPLLFCAAVFAAEPVYEPGSRLEMLSVGSTTYREVQIRSVNARTVIITHSGGMASIRLRDLSSEWQQRFRYDPAAESSLEEKPPVAPQKKAPALLPSAQRSGPQDQSTLDALLRQFGEPATIREQVDLRPRFFALELHVKSQGRRPSCAIFAVVSALELQHAELTRQPAKFSEEYLIWATRRTIQRIGAPLLPARENTPSEDDADAGFSLHEVVAALRGYGIPLHASMPNTFGRAMESIEAPPAAVVEEARRQQNVSVHELPGRDNATRVNNLVHALNAGLPVPVGLAWPNYRTLRTGYLSAQTPLAGTGHAVTLVGYRSPTGRLEDAVFIFKNSWGIDWGQGGYGHVTYAYLNQHLHDAVILEVRAGGDARSF